MLDPDHLVKDVATPVSLPAVVLRVKALVDDPKSSADEIGKAIGQHAAPTAKLLRLANSAMFGMSRTVDSVGRAVTVLGTRQVRDLSPGVAAARAFEGIPDHLGSMGSFRRRSVPCAVTAQQVAGRCARGRPAGKQLRRRSAARRRIRSTSRSRTSRRRSSCPGCTAPARQRFGPPDFGSFGVRSYGLKVSDSGRFAGPRL